MKYYLVLGFLFALVALGALFTLSNSDVVDAPIVIEPAEYDFGKILQSGGTVETSFVVVNKGAETMRVSDVLTSCSCTSATINKRSLAPNERAELKVFFDPNYHFEALTRFFRTVTVKTETPGIEPEVKIWAEVQYDLGIDKLKFKPVG